MNPFDPSLLEIFSAEQTEHVVRIRALIEALRTGAAEAHTAAFDEALRRAHTLKGAARAVGLEKTESLAHQLESILLKAREGAGVLDGGLALDAHRLLDAAEDVLAFALGNRSEPDISAALAHTGGPAEPPVAETPAATSSGAPGEFVRVNADYIDELVRSSSQLIAATSGGFGAGRAAENHAARAEDIWREWQRLRRDSAASLRRIRNDPAFEAVLACLEFIDRQFHVLTADARAAALAEERRGWELRQRSTELHRQALRVRMTPAESVFGAFGAMVRELAQAERKQVEFRADGLEVEADRVVLQALKDPVMHLLRNAVSHGIELPAERLAAGKLTTGSVRLKIEAQGSRLLLVVEDDGRGINLQEIAVEAEKQGLIPPGAGAVQSSEELRKLIFRPGFSTAQGLTRLAGRGLGLSVVEQAASRLQGEARVDPVSGGGTAITISVALSISTQHVLLLSAGGHRWGVPARLVRRLFRTRWQDLGNVNGAPVIMLDGQPVPLTRLADLLDLPDAGSEREDDRDVISVAVVDSGARLVGLIVDRFLDDREAIVKDLGLYDTEIGLSAGGAPIEDGTVAVILDVAALVERSYERGSAPIPNVPPEAPKPVSRILVVDDSITTRSLEKSILEAHGYSVRVAVDGAEALEKLRQERPDLVITDLIMPRLTGLQLLEQMKADKELADIPVIIVTSMENREDQERGLSLGADAYIVKRKFDQRELLETVRQIL